MSESGRRSGLLLLGGFAVWGSAFLALYGGVSLGCAWGWEEASLGPFSLLRGVLLLILAAHLLVLAVLLQWCWRSVAFGSGRPLPGEPWHFLGLASLAATGAALAATLWTGLPVLGLSACA
ncbi:Hypothetical protein HVPorG_04085 (plasmid) [Roseomonas mucosa]|uniref:Uncharacterized protein n=1 Tax=Roseomonas mucosa TaxID=207340 RepID=A0A1S8D7U5_9PROT|nr:hypothetical protein [Roseomonas mucosa]MDT8277761.1 hypothetical protein [Roseomonas mucosa]MDU7521841.1 hypothetical protein [Roseomonas mucosa]ONH84433.1 hypothetical protein APZ41_004115 [Roseomonas mucosa]QDJ11915.1 Hypothetical protein HVPorG_04085 [Roseomonas mucosa]